MKTRVVFMIWSLLLMAPLCAFAINIPVYQPQSAPATQTVDYDAAVQEAATGASVVPSRSVFQTNNLTPMLDAESGEAIIPYSESSPSGPRRARGDGSSGGHIGTGGVTVDPSQQVGIPVGDALVPLLLLLAGYACLVMRRRGSTFRSLVLLVFLSLGLRAAATTFDAQTRYSVRMLDERLAGFNNKTTRVGFTTTTCPGWDYVPGLVGKATLDVWACYKDDPELSTKAAAWYRSIYYYGEQKVNDGAFTGANDLDALNAAKIYCRLYAGATTDEQRTLAKTGMQTAVDGINKYVNTNHYTISGSYATGGWWHKNTYTNQMWCDGQYMGPALLAQLIEYNTVYPALELDLHGFTWASVEQQLDIAWQYLWDPIDQLLWHVFTTDKEHGGAQGWYNKGNAAEIGSGTGVYHSSECWSRACGWYIMALVDILESMDNAGYQGAGRARLITQLNTLARGLARRQDVASGCWYQLPKYTNTTCATYVDVNTTGSKNQSNGGNQCNYLESSGTCAFVASILKGIRLGYIDKNEVVTNAFDGSDMQTIEQIAKRGYRGIVTTFISNGWELTSSCESAGLSADRNGTVAYYLIGKDDRINDDTEGKAFGPFLLAAIEYERAYVKATDCHCLRVRME